MTDRIPGVMGLVVRHLKDDPDLRSKELYARAAQRYPELNGLTVRQFHARYALQAKKQLNNPIVRRFPIPRAPDTASPDLGGDLSAAGTDKTSPAHSPSPHEEMKLLLFRLVMDLETSQSRVELVDLIGRIDRYAEEALALGRRV